jgi:hypothetical protein
VDGYNMLANKIQTLRHKVTALLTKSDGLGDEWEEHSPIGVSMAEVAQEGAFFDTATLRSHAALKDLPGSPQATVRIVCLGFAGQTKGSPFEGFEGVYNEDYEVVAARGELQKVNAAYKVTGQRDPGQIIQELAAQTIDWDTELTPVDFTLDTGQRVVPITSSSVANPSVITTTVPHGLTDGQKVLIAGHSGSTPDINGEHVATVTSTTTFTIPVNVTVGGTGGTLVQSNSLSGGAGFQQVTAFSGFTGFIGTIRDSADDITYADLVVFGNVTSAPAAERKTVAGTIDRYLAFKGDVTGSGSITVFCGFSRS